MKGKFITVEGIEGAGKSSNLPFIQHYLEAAGKPLTVTREPGGTHLGEGIRRLLLEGHDEGMMPATELLLMFAARAEHLQRIIRPALNDGRWILCDRFTDATYAYQGGGRGIPRHYIAELEAFVQGSIRPDLTLLFDVPVDIGLARARNRSDPDRFEQQAVDFFERVREAYLQLAHEQPDRYRIIDARKNLEGVRAQLTTELDRFIGDHP